MANDAMLSKNWQDITVVRRCGGRKYARRRLGRILRGGLAHSVLAPHIAEYNNT